jgi:uncharacterized protein with beta-barrel porin domain
MQGMSMRALRRSLLAAASITGIATAGAAHAQAAKYGVQDDWNLSVVANHELTPGPGNPATGANYGNSPQLLDPADSVNGIGQQIVFSQTSPTGGSLGLCTGSLINPRTVITAAHCVYTRPAHMYGSQTGTGGGVNGPFGAGGAVVTSQGVPISFGFSATNRCLGVAVNGCAVGDGAYEAWRNSGFKTQVDKHIYNGNQVFYLTGSQPVELGGGGEFANGDIALVTLDTHVEDIPTWTLLFSPLDGPTHATITGYGGTGVGLSGIGSAAGIDYRRRSAENMIDALMSWHDQNTTPAIAGPDSTTRIAHQHAIYWMDFDDPNWSAEAAAANPAFFNNTAPAGARSNGYYDFNGLGGTALEREGSTAGGDSGGPLVVDQRWDRKVIAGVLTGSISYNGGISTYGQFNVYPPLFQFWEDIVQNNPYVYASAKAGNADWFDPTHWVQTMDPNYVIIGDDGELVNTLPDTHQGGADGPTSKFGTVCFLETDCGTITGPGQPQGNGQPVVTAGGPGSTNFVPNNVEPVNSADAAQHVKARYYDVTLGKLGTTTLNQAATIDRLTIDGAAKLDIKPGGDLKVWTDFTQKIGWTNVDGKLTTGEALITTGFLTGKGTFKAPYLTVVAGIVAPGGAGNTGTLTVDGDMIMASASALHVDASRAGADKLAVTGQLSLSDGSSPGASLVMTKNGAAPRHGDQFTIATAAEGVSGTFGRVISFQGVLRPDLTYTPTEVIAKLRAGSLWEFIGDLGDVAQAFALALDTLRGSSYDQLSGLYGSIDLMDASALASTLGGLAPSIMGDTVLLENRQSAAMLNTVTDRLGMLGTGSLSGLTSVGAPQTVLAFATAGAADTAAAASQGFAGALAPGVKALDLPEGMTGFVAGGFTSAGASYARTAGDSQRGYHMSMGLEFQPAEHLTLGTAFGYSRGGSSLGGGADEGVARTSQMAVYGAYRLGGGAYVAGLAAAERGQADLSRRAGHSDAVMALRGDTSSSRYQLQTEAGVNIAVAPGLTLTPKASVGYSSYRLDGYREAGGELALLVDGVRMNSLETRVGAAFAGSAKLGRSWTLVPQLNANLVQALSRSGSEATVRFAAAPGAAIELPLAVTDGSWGEVRGGLRLVNGNVELGAGVQHSIGRSDLSDDRAVADFTFRF